MTSSLVVVKLVTEVAVEWLETEILPFLAMARAGGSSKMVVVGMVAKGLQQTWRREQWMQVGEAVVCCCVCQNTVKVGDQSLLN
jgi:hypothetical protein